MGHGGGLDRLDNAKLAVTFAEDGGDPAAAAAAAERLITDGHVTALIGGVTDTMALAIGKVAQAHGLPFLALQTGQPNDADLTWFFRIGRTPARDSTGVLRQLAALASADGKTLGSIALVYENDPEGQARTAPMRKAAEAAGVQVADAPIPPGAALEPPVVAALLAAKPDAVLSFRTEAADVATLTAGGIGPLVLMQSGPLGTAPDGVFRSASFTLDPVPARPGIPAVDAVFKARTGRSLGAEGAREITGLLLLADVINRASSTKPIDLRTALMATDTPGGETLMLWDGIRFDDSGQNVRATPALLQAKDGAFRTVAPEEIAVATPIWPSAKKD